MAQTSDEALDTLRNMWRDSGESVEGLDQACAGGHKKVCRNSVHMSFDGYAEEGEDVSEGWRRRLESEGKLNTSGGSLRDLIMAPADRSQDRH